MQRVNQGGVGGLTGQAHVFTPYRTDGRSLHPLQRSGDVAHSSVAVIPAGSYPGLGKAPGAGRMHLTNPPMLHVSITGP